MIDAVITDLQRAAIEATYRIQPDKLNELYDAGQFDKSLIDDIGGLRCLLPIYYITKLWDLSIHDGSWGSGFQSQLDDADRRNHAVMDFWKSHFSIDVNSLDIDYSLYACDYQNGGLVLYGRFDVEAMQKSPMREIDVDLYRAASLFDFEETEKLLQAGADGQSYYNLNEGIFERYTLRLDIAQRFFDLGEDIGAPFTPSNDNELKIPSCIMDLMEMCALKKMMLLLESYGCTYKDDW